jgi:dynein light intermediate chain 2
LTWIENRIEELFKNLEKRGSKRPKAMRAYALKKYSNEGQPSSADRNQLKLLPINWVLVGTKYDLFRNTSNELQKCVSRYLRYQAHVYGGMLLYTSDREETNMNKVNNRELRLVLG